MDMDLLDALDARGTVTCVVGAGGKKSMLYALAGALERAVVTATVRIPPFEAHVADLRVTENPQAAVGPQTAWPLGLVRSHDRADRYRGYEPSTIDALVADLPDDVAVLVKADGARTRWFKAPATDEPQLPATADVVLPIASARIVGERLDDEHVHRPERVAALTGLEPGDRISAADVASVLTSPAGGWKGTDETATVIPVLNMVDTPALERRARQIASEIHERRDVPRVVLTCLIDEQPVVDVC